MNLMLVLGSGAGLGGLFNTLRDNWIAPVFFIIVAAVSIMFLVKREFRGLIAFIAIAVVVGLLIFFGDYFFGATGVFTKVAKEGASSVEGGGGVNSIVMPVAEGYGRYTDLPIYFPAA